MKRILNFLFRRRSNSEEEEVKPKGKKEIPENAKVLKRERYFQLQGDSFDLVLDIVSQKVEGDIRLIEGTPCMPCGGGLQGKPITFYVPAHVETFDIGMYFAPGDDRGVYEPKNFILKDWENYKNNIVPAYRGNMSHPENKIMVSRQR